MSEKLVKKSLEFSTADAENVEISLSDGTTLLLKFSDWQAREVRVEFSGVVAFSWNEEELKHHDLMDNGVFEVTGSEWLEKHREFGTIVDPNVKHEKFCFEPWGVLDVIFAEMKIVADE